MSDFKEKVKEKFELILHPINYEEGDIDDPCRYVDCFDRSGCDNCPLTSWDNEILTREDVVYILRKAVEDESI